jgi:hypothetical protein|tara:strand:+ start:393 stop:563 length:171 start_codon:yes stop_codon:yes gene_type:complete
VNNLLNIDDIKVGLATAAGLTNWMTNIDLVLQIAISVSSLIYIVLKVREQINKNGS